MKASTSTHQACNGTETEGGFNGWLGMFTFFSLGVTKVQKTNNMYFSVRLVAWRTAAVLELPLLQLHSSEQLCGGGLDPSASVVANRRQESCALITLRLRALRMVDHS